MWEFREKTSDYPLIVSIGYILFASMWIFISDYLVINMPEIPLINAGIVHHAKGLLFVFVTGGMLYILMQRHQDKFLDKNREIEALSQEVHHRVKNNLALITSLLELERENRDFDSEYEELLVHTNFKIRTISVIHELLYQQNAYSRIDLDQFLVEFNDRVVSSVDEAEQVNLELQFDNDRHIKVDIKQAVPIALFLYECVLYTSRREAESVSGLFIDLYKTSTNLYLSCHFRAESDVPDIDLETPELLELQLASTLLTQLNAYRKTESDESETVVYVDIPLEENEEEEEV